MHHAMDGRDMLRHRYLGRMDIVAVLYAVDTAISALVILPTPKMSYSEKLARMSLFYYRLRIILTRYVMLVHGTLLGSYFSHVLALGYVIFATLNQIRFIAETTSILPVYIPVIAYCGPAVYIVYLAYVLLTEGRAMQEGSYSRLGGSIERYGRCTGG